MALPSEEARKVIKQYLMSGIAALDVASFGFEIQQIKDVFCEVETELAQKAAEKAERERKEQEAEKLKQSVVASEEEQPGMPMAPSPVPLMSVSHGSSERSPSTRSSDDGYSIGTNASFFLDSTDDDEQTPVVSPSADGMNLSSPSLPLMSLTSENDGSLSSKGSVFDRPNGRTSVTSFASIFDSTDEERSLSASPPSLQLSVPLVIPAAQIGSSFPPAIADELAEAAVHGELEVLRGLLQKGADINSLDSGGQTPLLANALMNYQAAIVQFILKYPDYTIKGMDIEELEELIRENAHEAQSTLRTFKETVTLKQLQPLKEAGKITKAIEKFLSSELQKKVEQLQGLETDAEIEQPISVSQPASLLTSVHAREGALNAQEPTIDSTDEQLASSSSLQAQKLKQIQQEVEQLADFETNADVMQSSLPSVASSPSAVSPMPPIFLAKPMLVNDELAEAAVHGKLEILRSLLQKGANINSLDSGRTPLLANALMNNQLDVVRFILRCHDYILKEMDLEELEELMSERTSEAQNTLLAFKETVTSEQLQPLRETGKVKARIEEFLNDKQILIFSKRADLAKAMANAARMEQDAVVAMENLLKRGADINCPERISEFDVTGVSLLANALLMARPESVRYILNHPDYIVTPIDIEEVRDLIADSRGSDKRATNALKTLDIFVKNITARQLQGLDIGSIEAILPKDVLNSLKKSLAL